MAKNEVIDISFNDVIETMMGLDSSLEESMIRKVTKVKNDAIMEIVSKNLPTKENGNTLNIDTGEFYTCITIMPEAVKLDSEGNVLYKANSIPSVLVVPKRELLREINKNSTVLNVKTGEIINASDIIDGDFDTTLEELSAA